MQEMPLNDHVANDPALEPLVARLATLRPLLPAQQALELLYHGAFQAGQQTANRRMRCWQFAAAALTILLLVASIPLANRQQPVARAKPTAQQSDPKTPLLPSIVTPSHSFATAPISLDAWRVSRDATKTLEKQLARFKEHSPEIRAMVLGQMSRSIGNLP